MVDELQWNDMFLHQNLICSVQENLERKLHLPLNNFINIQVERGLNRTLAGSDSGVQSALIWVDSLQLPLIFISGEQSRGESQLLGQVVVWLTILHFL